MPDKSSAPVSLSQTDQQKIAADFKHLLHILRRHLEMDVAFVGEFDRNRRHISVLDTTENETQVREGMSDELVATYCKKIADGTLEGIIPDARRHPVTGRMPITRQLDIGAYLGVPIVLEDQTVYGTLCCYSHQAHHELLSRDLKTLKVFAEVMGKQLESRMTSARALAAMTKRVNEVLQPARINILFQPIYALRENRIVGYEALSRFRSTPYRTPDVWFGEAAQIGLGTQLEAAAIEEAMQAFERAPRDCYLALNISPANLNCEFFKPLLNQHKQHNIVLEVTEHEQIQDYSKLSDAIKPLRNRGLHVALDDAGAGYASFQHILELQADVIKLDISLIRNIHQDKRRQALTSALLSFARSTDCDVIAEGVESREELAMLQRLGINKVQGYYIGRPQPLPESLFQVPNPLG
ncbi:sensor domain-containing phosphodiesterase [Bowmanella dokdonensis]|uniref:EAL domain-containing protein n=1 Tax=Bowmanella dokdonensis TaxID=751969 RepID=A0A939DQI1_9ALTE|nr:EAL domain-containing protein [Bowmanella dokdonensis]MBN7826527.1 EAL domain-containing protein [Bowmanella dokdonensis]